MGDFFILGRKRFIRASHLFFLLVLSSPFAPSLTKNYRFQISESQAADFSYLIAGRSSDLTGCCNRPIRVGGGSGMPLVFDDSSESRAIEIALEHCEARQGSDSGFGAVDDVDDHAVQVFLGKYGMQRGVFVRRSSDGLILVAALRQGGIVDVGYVASDSAGQSVSEWISSVDWSASVPLASSLSGTTGSAGSVDGEAAGHIVEDGAGYP